MLEWKRQRDESKRLRRRYRRLGDQTAHCALAAKSPDPLWSLGTPIRRKVFFGEHGRRRRCSMKGTIFADQDYPNEVFKRRNEYHRTKTPQQEETLTLTRGHQAGVTPDHTQESQRIRCREASDVQERYWRLKSSDCFTNLILHHGYGHIT